MVWISGRWSVFWLVVVHGVWTIATGALDPNSEPQIAYLFPCQISTCNHSQVDFDRYDFGHVSSLRQVSPFSGPSI